MKWCITYLQFLGWDLLPKHIWCPLLFFYFLISIVIVFTHSFRMAFKDKNGNACCQLSVRGFSYLQIKHKMKSLRQKIFSWNILWCFTRCLVTVVSENMRTMFATNWCIKSWTMASIFHIRWIFVASRINHDRLCVPPFMNVLAFCFFLFYCSFIVFFHCVFCLTRCIRAQ